MCDASLRTTDENNGAELHAPVAQRERGLVEGRVAHQRATGGLVTLDAERLVQRALDEQRGGFELGQQVAPVVPQQHANCILTLG